MSKSEHVDDNDSTGLRRRSFLKAGGATAAAVSLGGIGAETLGTGTAQAAESSADGQNGWVASGTCWGCHQACGQRVRLKDGKAVQVHGVDGHPRGSAGEGREGTLCAKSYAQVEKAYDPQRIKQPYVRKDGKLKPVSWDEAFEEAAKRLEQFKEEHGPEKLLMMEGYDTTDVWKHLIMDIYGSPNKVGHRTICHGPWSYTWGWMGGVGRPYPDYKNTEYTIQWGRNTMECYNGQWQPKGILDAKENNDATVVTIDPRYTKTAQHSDEWLPIKPRTDGALALAMGHVIVNNDLYDTEFVSNWTYGFETYKQAVADKTPEWAEEKTGVDADKIREIAIGFAKAAPNCNAIVWTGLTNAGNGQKACQNIHALNALVGNIDRPGGVRYWSSPTDLKDAYGVKGVEFPKNQEGRPQPMDDYDEYPFSNVRGLAHGIMPEAVDRGDIAGAFMYWFSPVKNSNADEWLEALEKMNLVISLDAYWDGAAKKSDIVFPEASQLEKPMLASGGPSAYSTRGWVTGSKAAIDPQWDTKTGYQIMTGLADAMGYGDYFPWETKEEKINDALSGMGMTLDKLDEKSYVLAGEYGYEQWKDGGFSTATGKFEFDLDNVGSYSKAAAQAGISTKPEYVPPGTLAENQVPDDEYPLEFTDAFNAYMSRAQQQAFASTREEYYKRFDVDDLDYEGNVLQINTKDARKRGIETGDIVTVESPVNSIELMAYVTEGVRPGFVVTHLGWGTGSVAPNEAGGNSMMLHSKGQMDPISGMVGRHIKVEVTKGGDN